MKIIQVKTHKSYIIEKRSNNKVSFVEFMLNSRQFKLMTTGSAMQQKPAKVPGHGPFASSRTNGTAYYLESVICLCSL